MGDINGSFSYPSALLISDVNPLATALAEKLIGKLCFVEIVTNEVSEWEFALKDFTPDLWSVSNIVNYEVNSQFDYLVLFDLDSVELDDQHRSRKLKIHDLVSRVFEHTDPKSVFVFPYIQDFFSLTLNTNFIGKITSNEKHNLSVYYIGNLLENFAQRAKKSGIFSKKDFFLSNFYPLKSLDALEHLEKRLFSFTPSFENIALLGSRHDLKDFFDFENLKSDTEDFHKPAYDKKIEIEISKENLQDILSDFLSNLENEVAKNDDSLDFVNEEPSSQQLPPDNYTHKPPKFIDTTEASLRKESILSPFPENLVGVGGQLESSSVIQRRVEKPSDLTTKKLLRKLAIRGGVVILIIAFFLFVLPVSLLAISSYSLSLSKDMLSEHRFAQSKRMASLSSKSSQFTFEYLSILSKGGLLDKVYSSPLTLANILTRISKIENSNIEAVEQSLGIASGVFNDDYFDLQTETGLLVLRLSDIHNETGFLLGQVDGLEGSNRTIVNKIFSKSELEETRDKLVEAKELLTQLPDILGIDEPKTYALLFQNEEVARPSGGKIESLVLVVFSGGKLVDVKAYEPSQIDNFISGEVETPLVLKEYFSKEFWNFEDANFDVLLSGTAEQVSWFLDKSIDLNIDGVVSVNLETVEGLINQTHPWHLASLDADLTPDRVELFFKSELNDAELKNTAVEEMLQASMKAFLEAGQSDKIEFAQVLSENLESKNLQILTSNNDAQEQLENLSWGGTIHKTGCVKNCYSDLVGVIELAADNQYSDATIERRMDMEIYLEEGLIKRKLTLTLYKDNSNPLDYLSYIRLLSPEDSGFENALIVSDLERSQAVKPDISGYANFKQAGVFARVSPGETKTITFSWEGGSDLEFLDNESYSLLWYKQPGLPDIPVNIYFDLPERLVVYHEHSAGLTSQGPFRYNIKLRRDHVSRIFWNE